MTGVLGQGLKGIVVADGEGAVRKFYAAESEGLEEEAQLTFLGQLQDQGFNIGCAIPRLLEVVGSGNWQIEGGTYVYCNRMERIPGTCARLAAPGYTEQQTELLGRDLGAIGFSMHALSRAYVAQWKRTFTNEDRLLTHILEDKAAQVIREEPDPSVRSRVRDAARYLEEQCPPVASENTLSHLDFTLSNTQASPEGRVNGIVDWATFGLTNPSLSLYQLAHRRVWPYVKRQYEQAGGSIREDIVFAAAAIHLAWSPIICEQLGFPLGEDETRPCFEAMHAQFEAHASTRDRTA